MSTGKVGRPRDENVRVRILETAIRLLIEKGYRETTMKDISVSAQVSKQTLYRWWNNRAELLMESFVYYAEKNVLFPETDTPGEGLVEFMNDTFSSITGETKVLLRSLLAESIGDPDFAAVFFERFIKERQAFLAGKLRGTPEFSSLGDDRIDTVVDLIFGAMWYRLIFGHRPLDENLSRGIVRLLLGS